ncbi:MULTISPECIES: App1 family protein [Arthrobacter]|nr:MULTISPECIES: phosphatase domain-containing protein [Arthrobacter]NYG17922.1 phosphatidate phosphatase APP1 [Arthrobacter psychrochitiniphilus]
MASASDQSAQQTSSEQEQDQDTTPAAPAVLGLVMQTADVLHGLRTRVARATGFTPTIVAYPGYGTTTWVRVLARVVLKSKPPATNGKLRGWRAFTSVHVRNSQVEVEIDGAIHTVHADSGGLVDVVVEASLDPGWHTIILRSKEAPPAEAHILIVAPETTFGIVSDIDDTVMVTALPRPFLALWNTLVLSEKARTPTPGMAVLLDRLIDKHPCAPVLYLSTGPWNVAPALVRFLERNLYPKGVLLLTDWGPTRQRWFRSGQEHKNNNLKRLAKEFPNIQWLLVGDDGQHDPEIYADFARSHAAQTAAVAIRELSPGEALLAGGRAHEPRSEFLRGEAAWVSAPDGAGLAQQLQDLGFL